MENLKLNLGCGKDIKNNYLNLDKVILKGVDIGADIEISLPFSDNAFDEILCSHVVEHVADLLGLMRELYRITRADGTIKIIVPHFSFFGAYTDPTHKRFFGYHSFDYFTEDGDFNFYSDLRFELRQKEIRFFWIKNKRRVIKSHLISWFINLWPLCYERFFCWILPANELYFELKPIK